MTELLKQYHSLAAEAKELRDTSPQKAEQIAAILRDIDARLDALPSDQRRLLRMRYVQGWRWEKIAQKMCYSRSEVFRIHGRALDNLRRISENAAKN